MHRKPVLNPAFIVDAASLSGPVDFTLLFGRTAPVHIEIGSGRGAFLVHQAAAFPQHDFLGIEWAAKYYRLTADRLARRGLSNARIIRTDAVDFIRRFVPDNSVEMFHLYFPDPWPKRRHHKRRFFCEANLRRTLRCLRAGGLINFATDDEDYFQQSARLAQQAAEEGLAEPADFFRPAGAGEGEITGTNYERKYRKEGRPIYTLALRKSDR